MNQRTLVTSLLRLLLALLVPWLAMAARTAAAAETVTYYYTNPQGTVLATADAAGNLLTTTDYRPYGAQVMGAPSAGPGYTGHVGDPDSGLVYMQARYYEPTTGRFLSTDPVNPEAGSIYTFSRYAYTQNNPINRTDPDGRCAEDACIIEGGVAVSAGVIYVGAAALVAAGVCVEACGKIQNAIGNTAKSVYDHIVESRSKPPPPLPEADGAPHSVLDGKGGYTTYPSGKPTQGKQYRPTGKPHGNIPRPNVKEWEPNIAPDGTEHGGAGKVRPPRADEIPSPPPQAPPPQKTEEG